MPVNQIRKPSPRFWVRVSNACNNNCLFCHDIDSRKNTTVSSSQIFECLKNGIDEGFKEVVLSGGEATLNPSLPETISRAKSIGYEKVQLITNGRALAYKNYCDRLSSAGLDEITFSIHSHRDKIHDSIVQSPGAFSQSIRGLSNAVGHNSFIVNMDIVINRLNVMNIEETILFFSKLGVMEFDLLYIIPFGNAVKYREKLYINPEECAKPVRAAIELARSRDIRVWTNRMPPEILEGYEDCIQGADKLSSEVLSHSFVFEDYLRGGEPPSCHGDNCRHCFLRQFCDFMKQQEEMRRNRFTEYFMFDFSAATDRNNIPDMTDIKASEIWLSGITDQIDGSCLNNLLSNCENISLGFLSNQDSLKILNSLYSSNMNFNPKRVVLSSAESISDHIGANYEIWIPLTARDIHETEKALSVAPSKKQHFAYYHPSSIPDNAGVHTKNENPRDIIKDIRTWPSGIYGLPPCVTGDIPNITNIPFFYANNLGTNGEIYLKRLIDTFIKRKYFAKSLRCSSCKWNSACAGIQMADVINIGLKLCEPVL